MELQRRPVDAPSSPVWKLCRWVLSNGDEVRVDRFAYEADAVIVVGRIKAHTAFRGAYESGLVKMMAIGMGKREGADSLHRAGFQWMGERLHNMPR